MPALHADEGQWFSWNPATGSLTIAFPDGRAIASLWFPMPVVDGYGVIAVVIGSDTVYSLTTAGAELVPLPTGTTSVTLTASSRPVMPVFASVLAFSPYKQSTIDLSTEGEWFLWTPSTGPLSIDLGLVNIHAIYFPNPTPPITVTVDAVALYTVSAAGAEVVPLPNNAGLAVLTGTSSSPTYVFATTSVFAPWKETL